MKTARVTTLTASVALLIVFMLMMTGAPSVRANEEGRRDGNWWRMQSRRSKRYRNKRRIVI